MLIQSPMMDKHESPGLVSWPNLRLLEKTGGKEMKISARVQNSENQHHINLRTNDSARSINIPSKQSGFGSSANGGELL
jgi:hypothetical protein